MRPRRRWPDRAPNTVLLRGRKSEDFHAIKAKLRWHIDRYRKAVETLIELDDPRSLEIVEVRYE